MFDFFIYVLSFDNLVFTEVKNPYVIRLALKQSLWRIFSLCDCSNSSYCAIVVF